MEGRIREMRKHLMGEVAELGRRGSLRHQGSKEGKRALGDQLTLGDSAL